MIENPPKEMSEEINEYEIEQCMVESIFTPLVISIMPDITPLESAVFSGFEPNSGEMSFAKKCNILVWFKMSIRTKKKAI